MLCVWVSMFRYLKEDRVVGRVVERRAESLAETGTGKMKDARHVPVLSLTPYKLQTDHFTPHP